MVSELINKYIWLIQLFERAGEYGLSMPEISGKWEDRFDNPYSRRTFNNHREAISQIFGVTIECNRSTNRYFIKYGEDVSDSRESVSWLINTFSVNSLLTMAKERLSGRVSVEDIPSGHKYLAPIMEAMTDNREIEIAYHKYTSAAPTLYDIRPYAVKEYDKRWYLVGYCLQRNEVRVYGMDRINGLSVTGRSFALPGDFDVDDLFKTSFGIYLPDRPAVTVKFKAIANEAKFIRDLPLHHSQEEIERTDDYSVFTIFVSPNDNLVMEFCKYRDRVEVLAPDDLRRKVAETLENAAKMYRQ